MLRGCLEGTFPWIFPGERDSCHPQGEGSSAGGQGECLERWRGGEQKGESPGCELRGAGAVPEGGGEVRLGTGHSWLWQETTTHSPWTEGGQEALNSL